MNKFFTIAIAAIFVLAGSAITYAQSGTNFNGINVSAYGGIVFVGGHLSDGFNPQSGAIDVWHNSPSADKDQAEYLIDLMFKKEFSTGGSAFLKIRAATADSANLQIGRFRAAVNDDNDESDNFIFVKEIHFTQPILEDLFSVTVGKFGDVGSPNDAATSVGSFFTGDPTVAGPQGGNGTNPYGVQLDFNPISLITVQYQYLTQAYTHDANSNNYPNSSNGNYIDADNPYRLTRTPYNVLWVNFKPIEKGNYRIGYWRDTAERDLLTWRKGDSGYIHDGGGAEPHGIFLSFDQEVISNLSLFLRAGYRLDKTVGSGATHAGNSWQVGTKVGGAFWGRANDSFFAGIGQASYQENAVVYYGNYDYDSNYLKPKPETHIEVNYSLSVNDLVSFILFGQYVADIYYNPSDDYGLPAKDDAYGYAGGLKLVLNF